MYQKMKTHITHLREKMTATTAILVVLAILAAGSVYAMQDKRTETSTAKEEVETKAQQAKDALPAGVEIVGSDSLDTAQLGNSWPGEVVSYGNVPVQPGREGTIVEWRVKIGERVGAGQVLAQLSAPPATSELVQMLAEQAEGRARMRAQASSTKRFTETNNEQLRALLATSDTTTKESQALLTGASSQTKTASAALAQAREAVTLMRKNIRTMLDQMLAKHASMTSNVTVVSASQFGSLNRGYGAFDSQNQNDYEMRLLALVRELKNSENLPIDAATSYFASFSRLANTSIMGEGRVDIRPMATDDQAKFFDMLAKYRDAEANISMKETEYALMAADKTKEYAEQKKEVEEKIAENEKMVAMAEAEATASDAAYATVAQSVNGGLAIIAPRAGIVSTINKKVGDFVEPGMPVASLDTEVRTERFVRLQIPSNARKPNVGTVLSVMRPGFSQDIQKVRLTGVGSSLDTTGAYMADASFLTSVDWPVAASVRVLVPQDTIAPLVKLSAIWWNANSIPHVWGVSEIGRVFARKVNLGRTLGALVEVYDGITIGDRYVVSPTSDMQEDTLLKRAEPHDSPTQSSGEEKPMGGMEM